MDAAFERRGDALVLNLHVQSRAARTGYAGRHGGRIKVRLKAPPVDGAANQALAAWLALEFDVPSSAVRFLAGVRSRDKQIAIAHPRRFPPWLSDAAG